jgi:hypothetical protein
MPPRAVKEKQNATEVLKLYRQHRFVILDATRHPGTKKRFLAVA